MRRSGAEQEKRGGEFALIQVFRRGLLAQLRRGRRSERARNPVRIDDHDHRAIAKNGIAAEHRDVPQPARHRLHHNLFRVEDGVDDDTETLAADLHTTTKPSFTGFPLCMPNRPSSRASGINLLRSRSTAVSLICSMRCSPPLRARTSSTTASWGMAKRLPPACTISADTIASVRGILTVKLSPTPGTDRTSMVPPI